MFQLNNALIIAMIKPSNIEIYVWEDGRVSLRFRAKEEKL